MRTRFFLMLSGILNAGFSIIIVIISRRILSLEETGILTLAFAVAKLLLNIGKWGMRNYQVSDSSDIHFSEWYFSRVITVTLMTICTSIYIIYNIIFNYYSIEKLTTIFLVTLFYAVECIEDIYTGYYQKQGRLDISSICQVVRLLACLICFSISLIITRNLIITLTLTLCIEIVFFYFIKKIIKYFVSKKEFIRPAVIKRLIKDCFPLFLQSFLLIYISNAAKYKVDSVFGSEVQAYFSFLSMPIYAISLFSNIIFQPSFTKLSLLYQKREFSTFSKMMEKQALSIFVMSIICTVVAYFIGIPFLSLIFSAPKLYSYKKAFLILILGGIGLATVTIMTAVLTLFRLQKTILILHILTTIGIITTIDCITNSYGLIGITLNISIWIFLLAFALIIFYFIHINNEKRNKHGYL